MRPRECLEECVQQRQWLDAVTHGYALLFLGATYLGMNDLAIARARAEESLAIFQISVSVYKNNS
ncbi:MAG: hypothetical protein M3220_04260 [Chloroflexota bacterium]|nr:hypothetical protein [Chloroflexota bacterium]